MLNSKTQLLSLFWEVSDYETHGAKLLIKSSLCKIWPSTHLQIKQIQIFFSIIVLDINCVSLIKFTFHFHKYWSQILSTLLLRHHKYRMGSNQCQLKYIPQTVHLIEIHWWFKCNMIRACIYLSMIAIFSCMNTEVNGIHLWSCVI